MIRETAGDDVTFESRERAASARSPGQPPVAPCAVPRARNPETPFGRRDIDIAIGTLIGMRRCTEDEALAALVEVAHATHIGLGAVSRALVSVVGGVRRESVAEVAVDSWTEYLAATTTDHTTQTPNTSTEAHSPTTPSTSVTGTVASPTLLNSKNGAGMRSR